MTSKLLILGNGFDLQCGLQSRYQEFFNQEIIDKSTEGFGIIQLKSGVSGFWEKLLLEYRKVNGDKDYKWCSVEDIIKNTLWCIYYGENKQRIDINNGFGMQAIERERINSITKYDFEDISDQIEKYIFSYCFNFFDRLDVEQKNKSDIEKLTLLLEHLLRELHSFERRFCQYLKKQINDSYILNAVSLFARLTGILGPLRGRYNSISEIFTERENRGDARCEKVLIGAFNNLESTYVLSFNYTALFDLLKVVSPCNYVNVHGKLCREGCHEGCSSSSIIFGIDDKLIQAQSNYDGMRLFSKTYRKISAMSIPERVLPKNDEPVEIIFYGHSLSEADYSYFQSIFDYYNLYDNNGVNLFFCYSGRHNPIDAVYRLINEYGKTLTNKDQGKNLMHKLLLENRIQISEIY